MKIVPSELVFTGCQRGNCWCRTFFPSVSKAERISRPRKLWACTSCKGSVLLNWLSLITFWVWSRSTTHFSSVGSLEMTDRRYSKSFTTTHNCVKSWSTTWSIVSWQAFSPFALDPPCWWHHHGPSSQTAAWPSASGFDSSSPLSCTHPVKIEKAGDGSFFQEGAHSDPFCRVPKRDFIRVYPQKNPFQKAFYCILDTVSNFNCSKRNWKAFIFFRFWKTKVSFLRGNFPQNFLSHLITFH